MVSPTSESVFRTSVATDSFTSRTAPGARRGSALGGRFPAVSTRGQYQQRPYHYIAWNEVAGFMDVRRYTATPPSDIPSTTFPSQ